jgi:hypothetical protein
MKMNIQLHIEELLLDGFDPRDRHRIADALERELARLFRVSDLNQLSGQSPMVSGQATVSRSRSHREARESLDAGAVALPLGAPARNTGTQIAGALHTALRAQAGGRRK